MRLSRPVAMALVGMALGCGGRSSDVSGALPAEAGASHEAIWSKRIGVGAGTTAVAFDPAANVVVAGTVQGAFDASLGVPAGDAGRDSWEWDGFVAAFDRAGKLSWLHRWRNASSVVSDAAMVSPSSVATDADGVWVVGTARGDAVDLDGAILPVAYGGPFRVRYDRAGRLVSSNALPSACDTSPACQTWSPTLDAMGRVVVLTDVTSGDTSGSECDESLTSYDAGGDAVWSRPVGAGCPRVLVTSRGGSVAVLSGTGVAVLGADGSPVWSRSLTPGAVSAMAFDASGDLFIGGQFESQIDLGGPTPLTSPAAGSPNEPASAVFLATYDAGGRYLFARAFGVSSTAGADGRIDAFRVATNGDFVFTGTFAGAVDFGQGPLGTGVDSTAERAVFLARASRDGSVRSSSAFGAGLCDRATSVDVAADGRVAMGGAFTQTIDFGDGPLKGTAEDCPAQFGADTDAFIAVFPP